MANIVTMGEIMLRLSTPRHERLIQADSFDVNYGGGEANVAVSLAGFGHQVEYVTAVPAGGLGDCAVAALRKYGVGTGHIARQGERLGIYFLETGSSLRPSTVIYDRAGSSMATAKPEDFDFETILRGAGWFHITGITPAISREGAALTETALKAAKAAGVTVSVDLNYRKKLWTPEEARRVMTPLMEYVDVCIGNEEDAAQVLGFQPGNTDVSSAELELDGYRRMFEEMGERFGFRYVVSSLRESYSASHNGWSACILDRQSGEFYYSTRYTLNPIVDRVGGGDAFAAGLISSLADGEPFQDALEFAVAASALKHTIHGDFNLVSRAEVKALVKGDSSGRVQR